MRNAYLGLILCVAAHAADPVFKVGGMTLSLPGPDKDFVESGDQLRTMFFEALAPATNRLVSAYIPSATLEAINKSNKLTALDVYGMVETFRRGEYTEVAPDDFAQAVNSIGPTMSKIDSHKVSDLDAEMNTRLKAIGARPIEIGQPEMLGGIFKKPNAAAFAMLTAFKTDERPVTMAMGAALVRVKQRLVFVYLYRKYNSPEAVTWLRKALEAWTDSILAANK